MQPIRFRQVAFLGVFLAGFGGAQAQPATEALADRLEAANTPDERAAILRESSTTGPELFTFCFERGGKRYGDRNYDGAMKSFQAALAVSTATSDQRGIGKSIFAMGRTNLTRGEIELGVERVEKGLAASTAASDKPYVAFELKTLSRYYRMLGRLAEARDVSERGRALYGELGDKHEFTGMLLPLSNAMNKLGDLEASAALLRQCILESEAGGFADHLSGALNNLAGVYFEQGDYERSLQFAQRSHELLEQDPHANRSVVISSFTNMAVDLGRMGEDARALETFDKAIKMAKEFKQEGPLHWALYNRSVFYHVRGKAELALADLRPVAAVKANDPNRMETLEVESELASLLLATGDARGAVETGEKIAREARGIGAPKLVWSALETVGAGYLKLGDRDKARAAFLEAIAAVESMRSRLSGGEDEQENFFHDKVAPFHGMIRILVEEHQTFEAFQYAERAKARLLLDVLKSGRAEIDSSMSEAERQHERELSEALVKADSALARRHDPKNETALLAAWEKAGAGLDGWRSTLYAAHPELRFRRAEFQAITLDQTAELLPDSRTAVLEYTVTNDAVYLFVIVRDAAGKPRLSVHVLNRPATLARDVEDFRRQLLSRDLGYRPTAAALYNQVLGPVADLLRGKTRLVIVPDGPLWNVPFEALIAGSGRHLVEDAAMFYAPSVTATRQAMHVVRTNEPKQRTLLAFGGPSAAAVSEAQQIRELYGRDVSAMFTSEQATKEHWKMEAPNSRILHVATHGVLNSNNPMYSYLAFSSSSKAEEDGRVTAREILQSNLDADFAVLSACETARGRFRFGEGLIGMSWAFLVAGTPATLVSQWKVDSAGTSDLMVAFHRNLRAKIPKAEALQRAALAVMKNPAYRHPFYWAGFMLVGNAY